MVQACGLDSNEFLYEFQGEFQAAKKNVPKNSPMKLKTETQFRPGLD